MFLNGLKPASGSRPNGRRLGRGIGSGLGKTSGKGHKGQKARAGGYHKVGFEGGQMPLQRRLPKIGFRSASKRSAATVRLSDLQKLGSVAVTLDTLREANIVSGLIRRVTVIDSGEISLAVTISGIRATRGARAKIVAAGGKVED